MRSLTLLNSTRLLGSAAGPQHVSCDINESDVKGSAFLFRPYYKTNPDGPGGRGRGYGQLTGTSYLIKSVLPVLWTPSGPPIIMTR